MAGTLFDIGCQSSEQKVEDAKDKVQSAKEDLKAVQKDANAEAQNITNAEAWKTLKAEAEAKIKNNETVIAELKVQMKKPGKVLDALYEKTITTLEQKNKEMRTRIDAYDKSHSDWEAFKREFTHDMDELGRALNDLTVNNKK